MSIKDAIAIAALALGVTWLMNYFFPRGAESTAGPGGFVAAEHEEVRRPLNKEVDFLDGKRPAAVQEQDVHTGWGHLVFSTDGASLERCGFTREINGQFRTTYTLFPPNMHEREKRCFLVALDENTPFYYRFVVREDRPDGVMLSYEGANENVTIRKEFFVHQDKPRIDVKVALTPRGEGISVTPRILFPAPIMPTVSAAGDELASGDPNKDAVSVIAVTAAGGFEKVACNRVGEAQGWLTPTLFGTDIRYAVHALVRDEDQFTRRAYTTHTGACVLTSILEGPRVQEPSTWSMSFFMGPKEMGAIHAVDNRLEKTLDYSGILGPLAKMLLAVLVWLYEWVGNFGFAIIVLTIVIKLVLLPLTLRAERKMRQGADLRKRLDHLQQQYKHDPQRLAQERAEFIRKHGIPGVGGCLPMLIQLPIFFALSRVLNSALEMHQASMLWIRDLSAADPYYILPVLVTITMLLQATTTDPKQRLMLVAMACIFGAVTASFSAGLALYIVVSTLLSVIQTMLMRFLKWA